MNSKMTFELKKIREPETRLIFIPGEDKPGDDRPLDLQTITHKGRTFKVYDVWTYTRGQATHSYAIFFLAFGKEVTPDMLLKKYTFSTKFYFYFVQETTQS